ncbi:MAG: hypothetical protein HN597_03535 [Desulfobacula sp.]|jgi:hypothetical protein|uniref:hypothetical protein n=1 Tax=Desulfobacula sp. TaxID=2593537 RepID=UPI0039B9B0C2|nr:hypothetical protein [Desulfobacula sp.]
MGSEKTIQAIVTLIPVAVELTTRLLAFAEMAKADGYDVPTVAELQALNDKLKDLDDLSA